MQAITITQITPHELEFLIENSINKALSFQKKSQIIEQQDQLFSIQEASSFLNLSIPTIYSKVSKGELPVMKRTKRLYFSRLELIQYLKEGKRKSNLEIRLQAKDYTNNSKNL